MTHGSGEGAVPASNLHAGLVAIDGHGVLVTGPARSGKSSLVVSLLRGAAREGRDTALVADDRVVVERRGEALFGSAPAPLAGLVELSGIGLLHLACRREAALHMLVVLAEKAERLPEEGLAELLGVALPRLVVPPRQAPFAADLILTVLAAGRDALLKP